MRQGVGEGDMEEGEREQKNSFKINDNGHITARGIPAIM